MKLILEEDINYKTRINDFGVEPINKRIISPISNTSSTILFLFPSHLYTFPFGVETKNILETNN